MVKWWVAPALVVVTVLGLMVGAVSLLFVSESIMYYPLVALFFVYTGAVLASIPAFYLDSRALGSSTEWRPWWWAYTIGLLVLPPIAAGMYVFNRSRHTGVPIKRLERSEA